MGSSKFNTFSRVSSQKERPWKIHPVWQGIGCLMLIVIPIMAYAGAALLVEANRTAHWAPVPRELAQTVLIPFLEMRVPHLYANLVVALGLSLFGYAAVVVVYSLVYRLVGPPRYGPMDAPPVRHTPRRGAPGRGYGGRR